MDKRTMARELAMQALYQLDVQGDDLLPNLERFVRENSQDELVNKLANQWIRGCWENLRDCDEFIKKAAIKWQISRLSMVDKAILRLGAYQLKYCDDMPGKVIINEAIELAKKFSTQQSPGFVNGVLDAILKQIKGKQ